LKKKMKGKQEGTGEEALAEKENQPEKPLHGGASFDKRKLT